LRAPPLRAEGSPRPRQRPCPWRCRKPDTPSPIPTYYHQGDHTMGTPSSCFERSRG